MQRMLANKEGITYSQSSHMVHAGLGQTILLILQYLFAHTTTKKKTPALETIGYAIYKKNGKNHRILYLIYIEDKMCVCMYNLS